MLFSPKAKAGKPPPEGSTANLYYNHLWNTLQNAALHEYQNSDGRSEDEMIQNAASQAALTIVGDPHVVSNSTLRQELQTHIPRNTSVQLRGPKGTTSLTLAQARKHVKSERSTKKNGGAVFPTYGGPPQVPFILNRTPTNTAATAAAVSASAASAPKEGLGDRNRRHRNKLSPVPLLLSAEGPAPPNGSGEGDAGPAPPNGSSDKVTRVRKKCISVILDRNSSLTPQKKQKVKSIHTRLQKKSPGITETINDYLDFPSSQQALDDLVELEE